MKRIALLFAACIAISGLSAKPAYRGPRPAIMYDGTAVQVYHHGDEFFHWVTLEDGTWVERLADGSYITTTALNDEQIDARRQSAKRHMPRATHKAYPVNLAPRGLIILVSFKDRAFATSKVTIDSMMNGKDYSRSYSYIEQGKVLNIMAQGSAWQYFRDASMGQYSPKFDIAGPVTVSQNMKYYGANDSQGNDVRAEAMIKEACQLANSQCGVDFSVYDNDNDGAVDFVYVIYAGYGEADTDDENTVWPHSYWLSGAGYDLTLNGKQIDLYACGSELNGTSKLYDGIGTFCHEFSHVLGFPDLYTTVSRHKTLGAWDILDYGPYNNNGNTPPSYSAYERFFAGWLTPELLTEAKQVHLENLTTGNKAYLISTTNQHNLIGNDPNPTSFYLLENRQQTGWDCYIPGHGLMLTKINYSYDSWEGNTVNDKKTAMGVDLIEADGKTAYSYYDGKPGDLFPAGASQYTQIPNHSITDITETGDVVYFNHNMPTALPSDPLQDNEQILGIYTLTGISAGPAESLPQGVYIVRTTHETKKIIIP